MADDQSKNTTTIIIVVVILLLLVLGVGAYYVYVQNQQKEQALIEAQMQAEETAKEAAMQEEQAKADLEKSQKESAQKLAIAQKQLEFQKFVNQFMLVLSPEGLTNLDVIVVYFEKSPEMLVEDASSYPVEIQNAISVVQAEVQDIKQTVVITDELVAEVEEGYVADIQGVLEIEEDETFGTVFKVLHNEDQVYYYFVFNETNSEEALALVGEEVVITVEVTEILEDGTALYQVIKGPVLAEDSTVDETTQDTMTDDSMDDDTMDDDTDGDGIE